VVRVKKIAGPSSWNHKKHFPIGKQLENLHTLGGNIGVQHVGAPATIITKNLACRQDG